MLLSTPDWVSVDIGNRALGCKVDLKVYIQSHAIEYTRLGQCHCQYRTRGCKVDLKVN